MFLTPLAYCLFTSVVGLTINLFTPKLKWKNEAEVIKQSSSVLFTMLIGFAASGLPLYFMFTTGSIKIMMATTVAVLLVAVLLLIYLMRYGGKKLYSLTV
jgi:ABC-2 type transport system permease protein